MNAPERSAAFILDDDEQKIEYTTDTKATNAGTFRFNKEDYTLSNILRMQLLRDPNVRFAGFLQPHPLLNYFDLKIQTNTSTTDPKTSLSNALEDLTGETDHLITQVHDALEKWNREHGESMY